MEIALQPERVARLLAIVVALLVAAHVAAAITSHVFHHEHAYGLVDTFDLNFENNVPTFFATLLLFTCAMLLGCIARADASAVGTNRPSRHWTWLAALFLFLAVDEDASLHELLIEPVRQVLPWGGPLYFAWVVPYAFAVVLVGLYFLGFVRALPRRTRRLFVISGGTFLSGAIGFELVAGWYLTNHEETEDLVYSLLVAGEEVLEMSGLVLFIYALMDHLRNRLGPGFLRIRFR